MIVALLNGRGSVPRRTPTVQPFCLRVTRPASVLAGQ